MKPKKSFLAWIGILWGRSPQTMKQWKQASIKAANGAGSKP